jgi:MFS family permease
LWLLLWGIGRIAPDSDEGRSRSLDIPGAALFAAAIGGVLVAVNRSPSWGPASPQILGLVAVSLGFGAAFVGRELRTSDPMLDLRLFQHGDFPAAIAISIANFVANSGLVLLLPFYLVEGSGLSVDRAGMALVPLSLLMALIAPVSGRLGDRIGPRLPSTAGMLLLCVGTGLLALLPEFVPVLGVVLLMIVAGAGIGLFTSTNTTAIMAAVPQDRLGVAGGIVHTARYIGLTGGVALAGAVYTLVAQSESAVGSLTAYRVAFGVLAAIAAMGAILSGLTTGWGARQPSAPASEARR